jgi:hypothetical protein
VRIEAEGQRSCGGRRRRVHGGRPS